MKYAQERWLVMAAAAVAGAIYGLAAARGLCDFAWIARRAGDRRSAAHFQALAEQVRLAFLRSFTVPQGHLVAAVERSRETDLDTALAEAPHPIPPASHGRTIIKSISARQRPRRPAAQEPA